MQQLALFKDFPLQKTIKSLLLKEGRKGDTLVVMANLSKEYAQFTMPYDGVFKRYQDFKTKKLSSSYQYDMKPWEFWILIKE